MEMIDNGFNFTNSIMSKAPGIGGWDAFAYLSPGHAGRTYEASTIRNTQRKNRKDLKYPV